LNAITLSTGDIDFLKLRTVGDLRDKYVEITAHLLLGDATKRKRKLRQETKQKIDEKKLKKKLRVKRHREKNQNFS
jgi:hypothetical protein